MPRTCRCPSGKKKSRRYWPRDVTPGARYRVEFNDGRDLVSLPYHGDLGDARIGAFLEEQFERNPGLMSPYGYAHEPPRRARVLDMWAERVVHEYGAQPFFGPGHRRSRRCARQC